MSETYTQTGGARVGSFNASFPLAAISATQDQLRLKVAIAGEYTFRPGEVVSIDRHTLISILGWGIKIVHNKKEYPDNIIFWTLGSPAKALSGIAATGFRAAQASTADTFQPRKGTAFRWQAWVAAIVLWNVLFLLDQRGQIPPHSPPGIFSLIALLSLFLAVLETLRNARFRRLMLKPGRDIGEVTPFLKLLLLVSGSMSLGLLVMLLGRGNS